MDDRLSFIPVLEPEPFYEYPVKFQPSKQQIYQSKIQEALSKDILELGPFKSMVKSGEVYMTTQGNPDYPYCDDSSRPRGVMMP